MERGSLPRLAWFTPLPPVHSGIARYSAELLPLLSQRFAIDAFVGTAAGEVDAPDGVEVRSAHDFVWMHGRRPFDLVVYQLGNGAAHDYMWGYLSRYPGLVVMHDGQFHHARGHLLRQQNRFDDYDAEFEFDHPGLPLSVAELGASGRLGRLFFLWPMRRAVLASARMIAVHNAWLAEQLRLESATPVETVAMGVPPCPPHAKVAEIRRRHHIADDAVVFLALGEVTPQKRIPEIIRQLATVTADVPSVRLLLAGAPVSHFDALDYAARCQVADRIVSAGFIQHDEITDYLDAADVCLCLRWPTSRETSAAWLRCLAAGKPTIISDLVHTADVPAYDPRGWTVMRGAPSVIDENGWPKAPEPACVAVDLLDEEHSLNLAMHRLATDRLLRERLGDSARRLWEQRFTLERMAVEYERVLKAAIAAPGPDASTLSTLPAHFRRSGVEFANTLMESAGLDARDIDTLWTFGGSR